MPISVERDHHQASEADKEHHSERLPEPLALRIS